MKLYGTPEQAPGNRWRTLLRTAARSTATLAHDFTSRVAGSWLFRVADRKGLSRSLRVLVFRVVGPDEDGFGMNRHLARRKIPGIGGPRLKLTVHGDVPRAFFRKSLDLFPQESIARPQLQKGAAIPPAGDTPRNDPGHPPVLGRAGHAQEYAGTLGDDHGLIPGVAQLERDQEQIGLQQMIALGSDLELQSGSRSLLGRLGDNGAGRGDEPQGERQNAAGGPETAGSIPGSVVFHDGLDSWDPLEVPAGDATD